MKEELIEVTLSENTANFIEELASTITMTNELTPQEAAIAKLIDAALPIAQATRPGQVTDQFEQAIHAMCGFLNAIYAMLEQ